MPPVIIPLVKLGIPAFWSPEQVADNLEQQVYDKNGEPCKKSNKDHQNDATGYPIAYEFPINKPAIVSDIRMAY